MRLLDYNCYDSKNIKKNKYLNKRKVLVFISIILVIFVVFILSILYNSNDFVRQYIDNYIYRKNISSDNLSTIVFNSDDITAIYGYDKYIALLNKNSLTAYSSSGKKEFTIDLAIGTPIAETSGQYLVIGEKNSQKIYLVNGQNIVWQKDIEGQISRLSVNKNGYVTVIVTGTTSKNVAIVISPAGKELFYYFFSDSIAIDSCISNDNKYLAIAEINTTENSLQSNVKIISMELAVTDSSNSVVYIYPANSGEIISYIKYHDKGKLICMYDNSIHMIEDKSDKKLIDLSNKKDIFADIHLKDNFMRITEKSSGLFAEVELQITNIYSEKVSSYKVNSIPKSVKANLNTIAIFYGTEIDFVNTSGWLIKKYHSSQEIKDIVLGNNIIGIIYKDKLEILGL